MSSVGKRIAFAMALLAFCRWGAAAQAQPQGTQQAGNRVISGVVVSSATGQPLEDADVTLNDAKTAALVAETTTDAEGRFAFPRLPDGKFSLRATHRGYIASGYQEHEEFSTAIVTGDGLVSTGLKFQIDPQAVLYGTVADDSGDPVPLARITLYRQNERNGTENIVHAGGTVTDDLGVYEIPHLQPGNYFISVAASPWYAVHQTPAPDQDGNSGQETPRSPLDVAYATTYYADVTDAESATPIPVRPGDRIPVNFTLHPVPAVHITLQVPTPERGQPLMFPQLHEDGFGSSDFVSGITNNIRRSAQGAGSMTTIEFGGIAPGHYEMEFRSPRGESDRSVEVDTSSGDQVVDASSGENLADISGKVQMAAGEAAPARLTVSLLSTQGGNEQPAHVGEDGSFHMDGVRPGTYEVLARAAGLAVAATQVKASGATTEGSLLKVASAPVTLAVTLAEGAASVNGFAKIEGQPAPGVPASGVMVLLVPTNPAASRETFRRDQTDSDGSFSLARVIPGSYTIVAIEDGWTLDWARPEVIAHYLARGLKVTVPPHGKDIDLKDPVEAQPK